MLEFKHFEDCAGMDKKGQNRKMRRMYIRLSEEEYRRIKKKAEGYPSLSAYIIYTALKGGGDRLKQMKIMEE